LKREINTLFFYMFLQRANASFPLTRTERTMNKKLKRRITIITTIIIVIMTTII